MAKKSKPRYISLLHQEAAALQSIAKTLKAIQSSNIRTEKRLVQFFNIVLKSNNRKQRIK